MASINELTETIIGHGIEVHRHLGPGLSETAYERALCIELTWAGSRFNDRSAYPSFTKAKLSLSIVPIWLSRVSWSWT